MQSQSESRLNRSASGVGLQLAPTAPSPRSGATRERCFTRWRFVLATLLAMLLVAVPMQSAWTQPPEADVDVLVEEELVGNAMGNMFMANRLTRQSLKESLFSSLGGSEAAFQKMKREGIRREVDRVHKICELTPDQIEKLNDAIELDSTPR
jgi:hypothetical protein